MPVPLIIGLPLFRQGKSRDVYHIPGNEQALLVVATDRVSTHNVIHESEIPSKGAVLTALCVHWFSTLGRYGIPHHLLAYGKRINDFLPRNIAVPDDLYTRALIVKRLTIIPREFIFRGRLDGSLFTKYYAKKVRDPYGLNLPQGLRRMAPLVPPAFTPTEKSETDPPLSRTTVEMAYPGAVLLAGTAFVRIRAHTRHVGIEMIDGKCEVGHDQRGKLYVADEIGTPDSSRFCLASAIRLGSAPPRLFDKEAVRQEAEALWGKSTHTPLTFPKESIARFSKIYLDAFQVLTRKSLEEFQRDMFQ